MDLRVALTADLDPARLRAARALLDAAFGGFADEDWEHCLGGVHALALVDGELVGHAALVQRRLLYGGRALRPGLSRASVSGRTSAVGGTPAR